jgi:hypothetical protein
MRKYLYGTITLISLVVLYFVFNQTTDEPTTTTIEKKSGDFFELGEDINNQNNITNNNNGGGFNESGSINNNGTNSNSVNTSNNSYYNSNSNNNIDNDGVYVTNNNGSTYNNDTYSNGGNTSVSGSINNSSPYSDDSNSNPYSNNDDDESDNENINITASIQSSIGELVKGNSVTFKGLATNSGSESVGQSRARFSYCFMSGDNCFFHNLSEHTISALNTNETKESISGTVFLSLSGSLKVKYCVDVNNETNEATANKSDNCREKIYTIASYDSQSTNLTASELILSSGEPVVDGRMTLKAVTTNNGESNVDKYTTSAFYVCWVTEDTKCDNGSDFSVLNLTKLNYPLTPNSRQEDTAVFTELNNPGTLKIKYCADHQNLLAEANESDNCQDKTFTVTGDGGGTGLAGTYDNSDPYKCDYNDDGVVDFVTRSGGTAVNTRPAGMELIQPQGFTMYNKTWASQFNDREWGEPISYLAPIGSFSVNNASAAGMYITVPFTPEDGKYYHLEWYGAQPIKLAEYWTARRAETLLVSISPCAGDIRSRQRTSSDMWLKACKQQSSQSILPFSTDPRSACRLKAGKTYWLTIIMGDGESGEISPEVNSCAQGRNECEANFDLNF